MPIKYKNPISGPNGRKWPTRETKRTRWPTTAMESDQQLLVFTNMSGELVTVHQHVFLFSSESCFRGSFWKLLWTSGQSQFWWYIILNIDIDNDIYIQYSILSRNMNSLESLKKHGTVLSIAKRWSEINIWSWNWIFIFYWHLLHRY